MSCDRSTPQRKKPYRGKTTDITGVEKERCQQDEAERQDRQNEALAKAFADLQNRNRSEIETAQNDEKINEWKNTAIKVRTEYTMNSQHCSCS